MAIFQTIIKMAPSKQSSDDTFHLYVFNFSRNSSIRIIPKGFISIIGCAKMVEIAKGMKLIIDLVNLTSTKHDILIFIVFNAISAMF